MLGVMGGQQSASAEGGAGEDALVFWNPADKHADVLLQDNNLRAVQSASGLYRVARGNIGYSTGRRYIEFRARLVGDAVELAPGGWMTSTSVLDDFAGGESGADYSAAYYCDGNVYRAGGNTDSGLVLSVNEWAGVFLDLDVGTVWVRDNSGWAFAAPDTLAGELFTFPTGQTYFPCCNLFTLNDSAEINGDGPFAYDETGLPPFTFAWNGDVITAQPVVTWSPTDKHAQISLSGGNLNATMTGSANNRNVRSSFGYNSNRSWSQKRYFECQKILSGSDPDICVIGLGRSGAPLDNYVGSLGGSSYAAGYFADGLVYEGGGAGVDTTKTIASLEWVGMAIDFAAGKAWVRDSTGWVGDPVAGTGNSFTIPTGADLFAMCGGFTTNDLVTANFGASAFQYAIPSGFAAYGGQ